MRKLGQRFKKVLAGVLAVSVCLGLSGINGLHNASAADEANSNMPQNPVYYEQTDTTVWDYVYFGNYPQTLVSGSALTQEIVNAEYDDNGDTTVDGVKYRRLDKKSATYTSRDAAKGFFDWNQVAGEFVYFKYEPVKWRVLQNEGDTLLLLADTVLDCQRYERTDGKITWENCNVRLWLNGYSPYGIYKGYNFLTAAFSDEEQAAIQTSNLANPKNPFHGTTGGNATNDKVFLLSVDEMTNEEYGFPSDYTTYSKSRRLGASDYAKAMGTWMGSYNDLYHGNAIWLLRTPGSYQQSVSLVYWFGHVYQDGYYANEPYYGVAPAIRVSAESDLWTIAKDDTNTQLLSNTQSVSKMQTESDVQYASTSRTQSYLLAASAQDFSLKDAKAALRIALGITKGTDEEVKVYDLDKDGKVDLNEVKTILKISLGIIRPGEITQNPAESIAPTPTKEPGDNTSSPNDDPSSPSATPDTTVEPEVPGPIVTLEPTSTPTEAPLVQKDCEASGMVWIAGDSIAAYHSKGGYVQPLYGWGEMIGDYFDDSKTLLFTNNVTGDKKLQSDARKEGESAVYINNTALSSRSSSSYTLEPNYTTIKNTMSEGDYLFVSFGHNDERGCVDLYTDPFGSSSDKYSFKWYMKNYYIDPAIRAGAQPVLVSPIPRRYFYNGKFINPQLHTPYGQAMKELSQEYKEMGINVYYIDLHSHMLEMYETLGEEGTIPLHGKYGSTMDNTHVSEKGAKIVCDYIVEEMVKQNMNINKLLKAEYKSVQNNAE